MELGDIADIRVGFPFPSSGFAKDGTGPRLVRGDNIGHGTLRWGDSTSWRWPSDPPGIAYELVAGDLVLAMDRPWISSGVKYAVVASADEPALLVQRVARLRAKAGTDQGFLKHVLAHPDFASYVQSVQTGTSIPHLSASQIARYSVQAVGLRQQRAIAEVLGALDDKIAANRTLVASGRDLRAAELSVALAGERNLIALETEVSLLTRGRAPKYADEPNATIVINQKCVRDGVVSLAAARRTAGNPGPWLQDGDVLVNSTGQGTLGRVGVWREQVAATLDSHVTLVRFDPEKTDPWVGGEALLASQSEIEAMAEGSTGQTELSRTLLGKLVLALPPRSTQTALGRRLHVLHAREQSATVESRHLATLRDALLPHLMSGRLSVRQAETLVAEVL